MTRPLGSRNEILRAARSCSTLKEVNASAREPVDPFPTPLTYEAPFVDVALVPVLPFGTPDLTRSAQDFGGAFTADGRSSGFASGLAGGIFASTGGLWLSDLAGWVGVVCACVDSDLETVEFKVPERPRDWLRAEGGKSGIAGVNGIAGTIGREGCLTWPDVGYLGTL